MPLLDLSTITGRAAWVRARAGLADADPPYPTHRLLPAAFPGIAVAGADLPEGVLEMAEAGPGRRVLWFSRKVGHALQRVALAHGLYHHMTDLRRHRGAKAAHRECNVGTRELESHGVVATSAIERACDLFAGELLVPFAVLDRLAPAVALSRAPTDQDQRTDAVQALASTFNVPVSFVEWRLHDLALLRQTNFYVG